MTKVSGAVDAKSLLSAALRYCLGQGILPTDRRDSKASVQHPYVGLTLELQPSVVCEILHEASSLRQADRYIECSFFVSIGDRLFILIHSPLDIRLKTLLFAQKTAKTPPAY